MVDKMRALVVRDLTDDYSGCSVQKVDKPVLEAGQVLVRIRAATLGFQDLLMTQGKYQHKPELPYIVASEMSGDVAQIAEGVTGLAIGDKVVGSKLTGSFAEYGAFEASQLRRLPDGFSYAQGAATSSAYLTAYVSLFRRGDLQAGEWVLVHGAAGGVGLAAVDIAKRAGARVIAAGSSDEKLARVQAAFDVDAVVNVSHGFRERVKQITDGAGADIIYDPVGGDVFDESVRCIAWGGRLLVVGFASGRIPEIPVNLPLIKGFSVVGVRAGEYGRRDPVKGKENMEAIWQMANDGQISPYVHKIFPLDMWRDAFEEMTSRKVVGRIIVDPSQS
jgi:NADPH2:quinone reductase